jgi:hypothetical protein
MTNQQKDLLKSVPKLKKEAWKWFSLFIRSRDCLKTTNSLSHGLCYTCGKDFPFTKLQAGHFLAGRGGSVLFDEKQVHAQCMVCNVWKHGDFPTYQEKMRQEYGLEAVEQMIRQRHSIHKWNKNELIDIRENYKSKVNNAL